MIRIEIPTGILLFSSKISQKNICSVYCSHPRCLIPLLTGYLQQEKEKIQLELFESLTRALVFHQKPQGNKAYRHSAMYRLSVIFFGSYFLLQTR